MSFKKANIQLSYKSLGQSSISEIINPLLTDTEIYKRSVGFFSSSAFDFLNEGILKLAQNKGRIYLITSPKLSMDDVHAISLGYEYRNMVEKQFTLEFKKALDELNDFNLKLVFELIVNNILQIKVVANKSGIGMYHDKLAILKDFEGNKLVFTGSNNESGTAYGSNYEKVRVFKGWIDIERVEEEEEEFDLIWNGKNSFLDTYEFDDAVKKSVIEIRTDRDNKKKSSGPYKLYDYQEEAIKSWVNNGNKGFFVMATGTGKTVTALYALKELLKKEPVFTVIAVPYKHLVTQWFEDVEKIFPDAEIIKISGEIPMWENHIKDAIYFNKYVKKKSIILISTISSFYSDRFDSISHLITEKRILIVDEAHNFLRKIYDNKHYIDYDYNIGLSATPVFGKDEKKSKDLVNFFGGIVFDLPIEKAIGKHLVNYNYYPIFVNATQNDEYWFSYYTRMMQSCFDENGNLINEEKFQIAYRGRLKTISVAENKMNALLDLLDKIQIFDHFIIYCSDGKIYDDSDNNIRHLEKVVEILNDRGLKPSQFTATENMNDRMRLIENFNAGRITTLAAIRCLDEGINIPSIKTAIIISSNDNYREFVQRRGRILRKYKNKTGANIYDFIVLPSVESPSIAAIELRRYYEYAKLALNSGDLIKKLEQLLFDYELSYEDITFINEFIDGGNLDD